MRTFAARNWMLATLLLSSEVFADEGVTAKNTIYLEGGGPAGVYSVNYERRISDINLRAGFSYWGNSYFSLTAIPLGVNYIGIGGTHSHLELGGGATIVVINGDSFLGDSAGAFGWGLVGYRLQPPDGGFNFRVGALPLIGDFGVYPYGYLSFGATF
jgi:hypothetical protein